MSAIDEKWMRLAISEAKAAKEKGELPFGAVIIMNGKVIGNGHCQEKKLSSVLMHAEAQAVDMACRSHGLELTEATIYCTNEPCNMCAAAIFQAKIPKVVVGVSRYDLPLLLRKRSIRMDQLAADSGYKIQITKGVLKSQVLSLFNKKT